jgi:hypothetical protein
MTACAPTSSRASTQPGSALRFAEMQKRYGLGVSRLREALAQLAADRLVIREVNRGFRVPEISLANFDDIAAMRLKLEPEAFRISSRTATTRGKSGSSSPPTVWTAPPNATPPIPSARFRTTGNAATAPSTRR